MKAEKPNKMAHTRRSPLRMVMKPRISVFIISQYTDFGGMSSFFAFDFRAIKLARRNRPISWGNTSRLRHFFNSTDCHFLHFSDLRCGESLSYFREKFPLNGRDFFVRQLLEIYDPPSNIKTMHTHPKSDGLFARRRTIKNDDESFLHISLIWLAGILLILILCGYQYI